MQNTPFNFAPVLRQHICPELTAKELATIAGVDPSTISRWQAGHSQPSIEHLRRWFSAVRLPLSFRQQCFNVAPKGFASRTVEVSRPLDANRDGSITVEDAELLDAEKLLVAAHRRMHMAQALADGRVSPDELASQQRMSDEEIELSMAQTAALEHVAGRGK